MPTDEPQASHDGPDGVRRVRRGSGERARLRREAQRATRRRIAARLAIVIILGGVAVASASSVRERVWPAVVGLFDGAGTSAPAASPSAAAQAPADDPRGTLLVATYDDGGEEVTGVTLISLERDTGRAAVVLLPTTMVADVPGYGLLPLGDAGSFGGVPLLSLTVENQLGIAVDATASLTRQDWAALFGRVGGFEVDVREPLTEAAPDGTRSRRFEPGPQFLDGPRLAELLTFEVLGEAELTSFARVQQVLEGFLDQAAVGDGLDALFADGAPMLGASDVGIVEEVLRGTVEAAGDERVDLRTLPVTVIGSGEERFYRLDDARASTFVAEVLGGTEIVADAATDGLRLEVLNGNGAAGIGADVAALLVPLGHTVVITRNAEAFDHPATRVLVYEDSDEALAAAQEIIAALGVGRVEISAVSSAIVDITILVGADFRR